MAGSIELTVDSNLPSTDFLYLSSESESDSEAEWRASIRAALEEDLQHKVRLRLGSLVQKWRSPQGRKSFADVRPQFVNAPLQRLRFQEPLKSGAGPHGRSLPPCSDPAVIDTNENNLEPEDHQNGRLLLAPVNTHSAVEHGINGDVSRCSEVDHRLRWPPELKIVHPTPQHRDGAEPHVHGDRTEPHVHGDRRAEPYVRLDGGKPDVHRNGTGTDHDAPSGVGTALNIFDVHTTSAGADGGTCISQSLQNCDLPLHHAAATSEVRGSGRPLIPDLVAPPSDDGPRDVLATFVTCAPRDVPAALSCTPQDVLATLTCTPQDVLATLPQDFPATLTYTPRDGIEPSHAPGEATPSGLQSINNGDRLSSSYGAEPTVYDYTSETPVHICGDKTLVFESRFECGNLHRVTQVSQYHYNLLLRTDLYTDRHTQWYYFKVSNMEVGVIYTFSITNLMKKESLYQEGLRPLLYSEKEATSGRCGWSRVGYHISYHPSKPLVDPACWDKQLYTLTWEMEFPWSGDQCYLAHCYPYPYTKLLAYLDGLGTSHEKKRFVKRDVLCHTLAGNICPVLTITDFSASEQEMAGRRGVVISARVHPGETNGSWMMQGVMDVLTSSSKLARNLRSNFIFKLVPMLNPDGVVVGNYRTSLAGLDLNRVYRKPSQDLCPTVWSMKRMIQDMMEEREVLLYVDLHGHSRKQNIFNYGCHDKDCDHTQFLNERVFCFLLSQLASDKFSYPSCKFSVRKSKRRTGRVVVWKMGVANSFTMEASFCGSTLRPQTGNQVDHFTTDDLLSMGRSLCEAIQKYHHFINSTSYQRDVLAMLAEQLMINCEGNSGEEEETTPISPTELLPPLDATPTAVARESPRRRKARSTAVLNRFMKMDLKLLSRESSTSGSGSDSGNTKSSGKVEPKMKKKKRKKRKNKEAPSAGHVGVWPHGVLHPPHPVHLSSITQFKSSRGEGPQTSATEKSRDHSTTALRSKFEVLPNKTRFINRYANRSNGGIPMFAEERLRERQEKEKLLLAQSVKPIISDIEPLPHPHSSHSSTSPLPTTCLAPSSIPLLWKPIVTPDNRNDAVGKVNQHYQRVRDLVEGNRHVGGHQFELRIRDPVGWHHIESLKPRSLSEGDLKATPTFTEHRRGTHWVRSHALQHRYVPAAGRQDHTLSSNADFTDYLDHIWRSTR